MNKPSHIFIVGMPRSGTSLLRHILNISNEVSLCSETHFFGPPKTSTFLIKGLIGKQRHFNQGLGGVRKAIAPYWSMPREKGIEKIVDHVYKLRGPYWSWLQKNVARDVFQNSLLVTNFNEQAFFDLLMILYSDGVEIRGEKTPNHLYYVSILLDWYPRAKIIHMIRDPRAVYYSQVKKTSSEFRTQRRIRRVNIFFAQYIIIAWRRVVWLHHQYRELFPESYQLCKFEDLISNPENSLKHVCESLAIDYSNQMLEPVFQNSSYINDNQAGTGFDTNVVSRWRGYISPFENSWFINFTKEHLLELGYAF